MPLVSFQRWRSTQCHEPIDTPSAPLTAPVASRTSPAAPKRMQHGKQCPPPSLLCPADRCLRGQPAAQSFARQQKSVARTRPCHQERTAARCSAEIRQAQVSVEQAKLREPHDRWCHRLDGTATRSQVSRSSVAPYNPWHLDAHLPCPEQHSMCARRSDGGTYRVDKHPMRPTEQCRLAARA
jgi:hypothetical protein